MARPTSRISMVLMTGPLAPFADAYRAELRRCGYTPRTMIGELRQAAWFSRWLEADGLSAAEVSEARVEEFLAWQRAEGRHRSQWSRPGLRCLLDVLRGFGVLGVAELVVPSSPTDVLLARFEHYLLAERGLAVGTVVVYLTCVRRFVAGLAPDREIAGLVVGDVTAAVLRESEIVSVSATQNFVSGVRWFLRFCFIEGLVGSDLSRAALLVRGRSSSPLPRGISRADARALLASCDRRRPLGRRDYAIIITPLRPGLRRGEVAGLRLDDIDWRAGELVVRGKADGKSGCLCRPMWAGRSPPTCAADGRAASGGRCFCGPRLHMSRSLPGRWRRLSGGRAGAPGSRSSGRTGCGTRRRARWSKPTFRLSGSGRCCAIGACRAPQSTRA
jgi:integrase/recombinase XerD